MEKIIIEIKRKHFLNSSGYIFNSNCPLALAAKEYFKNENVSAGGITLTVKSDEIIDYRFDDDYWEKDFVESKIEEAQKCLKSKKKFNSVFLKLEKI